MAGAVAGELPPSVEHVGVDGCPTGWLAAGVAADDEWSFAVFEAFADLWDHIRTDEPDLVLVDVPIGLREDAVRRCDEEARDLLGSRWNSVFRTPVERAVEMKRREGVGQDHRPDASEVNDRKTGYGLSAQVWNITDKIAELDEFFERRGLDLDGTVREAHPELAFMAFNGQPVAYSKTTRRGRALRTTILEAEGVAAAELLDLSNGEFDGADVGHDDVLDAVALGRAARVDLTTVPQEPSGGQPRIYFPDRTPAWDAQSYFSG